MTPPGLKSYAPLFGIEDDHINDQFYRELGVTVRQTLVGWVVILLGDTNANLGDSESLVVGLFSEDRENTHTWMVCCYLLEEHHAVNSTALTTLQIP